MRSPTPRRVSVVHYVSRSGKRVRKGTPGARKVRVQSETYYAKVGGRRVSLGTADEAQAWEELKRRLRRRREESLGIARADDDLSALPIGEHVDAWLAAVRDAGSGQERCDVMGARVRRLAGLAAWERLGDVTADSCLSALAKLQSQDGLAAQTRNHYLSHAKQFLRWCCPKRLPTNPLAQLRPVSVEADRRHDRRCPTDEEISTLMAFLYSDRADVWEGRRQGNNNGHPVIRGRMTGPQRALGYRVAMATGLRAGELRSLSPASFDLEAGTVSCRAGYSKRRRKDTQHLPPWLVEELRAWFAAGGGCWEGFPEHHPGQLLKDDLERADVPYVVDGPDGPLFFDFHALRHWYCTWAANQPGISPKSLMEMCRHSTPALTLKVYAKARTHDLKAHAERMPAPAVGKPTHPVSRRKAP